MTDVIMDWTSIVYNDDMTSLAKYGYARDHRLDKKQVTPRVVQLAPPMNVLVALTVEAGNINNQEPFRRTYDQVRSVLNERSLVVFDKGANDERNLEGIMFDHNDYLTPKQLNSADDRVFGTFDASSWERIDAVYGVLFVGFIAQLFISLARHFVTPVSGVSTKFISNSLPNLTETVVVSGDGRKRRFYSKFDALNLAILAGFLTET